MPVEHPVFKKPNDANARIWRYMSFANYVSLLDRKALHFTRVDRLEDKYEAQYPKEIFDPIFKAKATEEQRHIIEKNKERILRYNEFFRRNAVVNCWSISDYESHAMWDKYACGNEAIAIQSTYKRLFDSFQNYYENDVFIGLVFYIDYKTATIPWKNALEPFVRKHCGYEFEKKLRVLLLKNVKKELEGVKVSSNLEFPVDGTEAKINIGILIEKVIVSPKAEKWFENLVVSITRKYGLDKTVTESSLR